MRSFFGGRILGPPTIRTTRDGAAVAQLLVREDSHDPHRPGPTVPVHVTGELASRAGELFAAGDRVQVAGRLETQNGASGPQQVLHAAAIGAELSQQQLQLDGRETQFFPAAAAPRPRPQPVFLEGRVVGEPARIERNGQQETHIQVLQDDPAPGQPGVYAVAVLRGDAARHVGAIQEGDRITLAGAGIPRGTSDVLGREHPVTHVTATEAGRPAAEPTTITPTAGDWDFRALQADQHSAMYAAEVSAAVGGFQQTGNPPHAASSWGSWNTPGAGAGWAGPGPHNEAPSWG